MDVQSFLRARRPLGLLLFVLLNIVGASAHASAASGRDIMQKQKDLHKINAEFDIQKMILVDKSGKKETRDLKHYTREVEKDVYKALLVFMGPTEVGWFSSTMRT